MVALFDEFKYAKNKEKRKTYHAIFEQKEKDRIKRKWKEKMHELQKHILCFDFVKKYYVSKNISKNSLNMVIKSNFVKEDNIVVRFTHPPLDAVIINCKGTEINASPFTEYHVNTPISIETKKIIEQKNFVNNSLHIIGQQLNCIEEKVEKPTSSIKIEQPLIDLPGQRHNLSLKTTQTKTIEKVEQMLFDLQKMKTKQNNTSTSTARAISRKGKEISSSKDLDIDS